MGAGAGSVEGDAAATCEIGDELPGHPPGTRAARLLPLDGLGAQGLVVDLDPVGVAVATDHGEEIFLAAGMEAEPETEPVGERDLLLDGLARVDAGLALVLDHLARHQVAAVRRGVEDDIRRPPLDAAVEYGLQRLVVAVVAVEGEVVAEEDEPVVGAPEDGKEAADRRQVLAVDLDELDPAGKGPHGLGMGGLDEAR